MNKILIVKTSALGDIVQTYPVLEYLRHRFPSAQIDWIVEEPFAGLVQSHPFVNNILTVATKRWRKGLFQKTTYKEMRDFLKKLRLTNYDVVFDLQGNVKSGLVLSSVHSHIKIGFAKKSVAEWPNLLFTNRRYDPPPGGSVRDDYLSIVKAFFADVAPFEIKLSPLDITEAQRDQILTLLQTSLLKQTIKVMVCPGSAWLNKQLTQETLKELLIKIQKYLNCSFLLIWGSEEERKFVNELNQSFPNTSCVVDRMSLPMLQNLMEACDLVIAMDSLPLHLAGTTSTPSFSVFGPSSAQKYKPTGDRHLAYQGTCPYGRKFTKRCPILRTCPTGACIRNLTSSELFKSFHDWWADSGNQLD